MIIRTTFKCIMLQPWCRMMKPSVLQWTTLGRFRAKNRPRHKHHDLIIWFVYFTTIMWSVSMSPDFFHEKCHHFVRPYYVINVWACTCQKLGDSFSVLAPHFDYIIHSHKMMTFFTEKVSWQAHRSYDGRKINKSNKSSWSCLFLAS